jgi:hypothetical protein
VVEILSVVFEQSTKALSVSKVSNIFPNFFHVEFFRKVVSNISGIFNSQNVKAKHFLNFFIKWVHVYDVTFFLKSNYCSGQEKPDS